MHHTEMLNGQFYEDTITNRLTTNYQQIHAMSHKILRHPSAIACWYRGGFPNPICTEIHPTNECDNMCVYCHYKNLHPKKDHKTKALVSEANTLSSLQLESIIDQLATNNCQAVIFSGGGEPLMNPNTIEAVKRAKSNDMNVGFITNGQLIDREIAHQLIVLCTWIRVSLSATTKENFIKVRGIDKFDDALNGINELCLAKFLKHSNVTLGVQWIYTRLEPFEQLDRFIQQWLSKRPIDYLQIIVEQSYNAAQLLRQANLKQAVSILQNKYKGVVNIISSKVDDLTKENFGRNYTECHGQAFVPMIAADNKIYLCCHLLGEEKALIGDLNEQSFEEVWYSQKRQNIARNINIEECMPLCKHHEINKFLHAIKQPMQHQNFL
jgi:MoaA/NifB/PqqE/SkfB family radical SAM enzyme